jgi:hypothetical protein
MKSKSDIHSAAPQATGYLYQCRYALLESIIRIPNLGSNNEFNVSLESIDDIVFDEGESKDLLQTKHHIERKADLTDGSTDLWRTLRIWCDNTPNLNENCNLFLITTSTAPEGSAVAYLRPNKERNELKALEILDTHVKKTKSKAKWYDSFESLSKNQKKALIKNVFLIDNSPSILDIPKLFKKALYWAAPPKMFDSFLEQLEGWWFKRVIDQLNRDGTPIKSREITLKIDLSKCFTDENFLKADDDIRKLKVNKSDCENFLFVHQLKIIRIDDESINSAMSDFYRAKTQRSRWIRQGKVLPEALEDNDEDLEELWATKFRKQKRKLNSKSGGNEKIAVAQELYEWMEDEGMLPNTYLDIKSPFIIRGSYHYLADELRIGWHVDFKKLLENHKRIRYENMD